jgi:FixJ family two-component response regulator
MCDDNEITRELDTSDSECVYRFVKKPLKKNEIKQAVKTAIACYENNVGSKEHAIST